MTEAVEPNDEFLASTNGYSPQKFYTMSADPGTLGLGNTTVRLRIPKQVSAGIRRLVQSGRIPELRTMEDGWRNALYHGLHCMEQVVDDPEFTPTRELRSMLQLEDAKARREYHERIITMAHEELDAAKSAKEKLEVRLAVRDVIDDSDDQHVKAELTALLARFQ